MRTPNSPHLLYFIILSPSWDRMWPGTLYWRVKSPGQTAPRATECKEIMRDCKKLHARMAGTIMNNKMQKGQMPFPRCHEQKQGTMHDPCTQHHQGRPPKPPFSTQSTNPPLPSPHFKEPPHPPQAVLWTRAPVFCFPSLLLQHESQ